jgi:hypothetical protein
MSTKRPWFSLITFCLTSAFILAVAIAIFVAGATVAVALAHSISSSLVESAQASTEPVADSDRQQPSPVGNTTFSGLVTDDHCGSRHDMGSGKSPAECANSCVHEGAKYALVDGEKTYTLEGNTQELGHVSGQRVSLTGVLHSETIRVQSISSQP